MSAMKKTPIIPIILATVALLLGGCGPQTLPPWTSPATDMVITVTKTCPKGLRYEVHNPTEEAWDIMFAQQYMWHLVTPNGPGNPNPIYVADYPTSVATNGRWAIAPASGEAMEHHTTEEFEPCP